MFSLRVINRRLDRVRGFLSTNNSILLRKNIYISLGQSLLSTSPPQWLYVRIRCFGRRVRRCFGRCLGFGKVGLDRCSFYFVCLIVYERIDVRRSMAIRYHNRIQSRLPQALHPTNLREFFGVPSLPLFLASVWRGLLAHGGCVSPLVLVHKPGTNFDGFLSRSQL